ncbi:MAG: hypothetical protein AAGA65_09460 [Actinomycetota bacterium]
MSDLDPITRRFLDSLHAGEISIKMPDRTISGESATTFLMNVIADLVVWTSDPLEDLGHDKRKPLLTVEPPLFLVTGRTGCWDDCGTVVRPVGLIATLSADGEPPEPAFLQYVTELPDDILGHLVEAHHRYKLHRTRGAGFAYYACFCDCGAIQGDHHLHTLGGPFSPMTEAAAADITVTRLPQTQPFQARAEHHAVTPSLQARLPLEGR